MSFGCTRAGKRVKNRRNGEGGGGTPNSIQSVEGIGCIQSGKGVAILNNRCVSAGFVRGAILEGKLTNKHGLYFKSLFNSHI